MSSRIYMQVASFAMRMLLLVAPAGGCVLIVPTIERGTQCAITGTSACATCIRTHCQATVNACCDDPSCSGNEGHSAVLDALDQCATGDKTGCASGLGDAQSTPAGAVRSCVIRSCQEACLAGTPIDLKWTCDTPRSRDNECASCVYANCATALDSCCADLSCTKDPAIQKDVSACVGGDAAGCVFMTSHTSTGAAGVVRACIAKQCNPADNPICFGDYRTHQSCELYAGGSYCQCHDAEESAGPDCSQSAVGGTCVVASSGCTCGSYSCGSTTLGCSCSFGGKNQGTECSVARDSSGDGQCCLDVGGQAVTCACEKYTSECRGTDEYPVATCDLADVTKKLGKLIVPKCSK